MADLSKLSDEELLKAAGLTPKAAAQAPEAQVDLSQLSDEELNRLAFNVEKPQAEKGLLQTVGETVDKYTGAPTRAALSELTRTENEFAKPKPSFFGNLVSAGKAFANQFGEDPALAPTGRDIAVSRGGLSGQNVKGGVSSFQAAKGGIAPEAVAPEQIQKGNTVMPADVAGLAIDIAADPLNLVPVGALAKGASIAAKGAAKGLGRFAVGAAKMAPGGKAITEGAGRIIGEFVNPKRAADFAELSEIAAKNGIDLTTAPEAVEFGKNSLISRMSRVQAEGPLGQKRLDDFTKFMGDTTQAFDNKVAQVSQGSPLSRIDAGVHLRESFDRATDELFQTVGESTYDKVVKAYPGLRLSDDAQKQIASKLNGIEKFAQGQLKRGISDADRSQARGLINAVNAIRNTNGSMKQAVEELQAIGRAAYKPRNSLASIPPDIEKLRDIYSALRDGIYSTIQTDVKDGEEILGALKISNDLMTEFFGNREAIGNILGNPKLAPEQVFDRLMKNTKQIDSLKNILQPQDFAKLKGAYLDSLITRDELGNISWKSLQNALGNRSNEAVVSRLFEPGELKELLDIAKLGERAGIPIMSTSGTGASNLIGNIKDLPARAASEMLIDTQKAKARGLALPRDASRAVSSGIQLGPKGISAKEAIGLKLPQQISIQQQNEERRKSK